MMSESVISLPAVIYERKIEALAAQVSREYRQVWPTSNAAWRNAARQWAKEVLAATGE